MAIYFQILWRRIHILILVTVITTVSALGITLNMEPVYRAEARLLVAPFGLGSPDLATYYYSETIATTFSVILDSEVVEAELKAQVGEEQASEDYSIAVIPNSELLQISVRDTDPYHAQVTANALAEILVNRLQSRYSVNLENIEGTLSVTLDDLETEIQDLIVERAELLNEEEPDTVRIAEVERLIEVRALSLTTLLTSYNEALIDQATQDNLISVFEEALLPVEPAGPSLVLNLAAGIVAGVFGGLLIVFFMELVNPKVYINDQFRDILGADVIGEIPRINAKSRDNVFAAQPVFNQDEYKIVKKSGEGDRFASEAFRRLRTKIGKLFVKDDRRVILCVSAHPGDGKSTVAVNLAIALARSFKRVLLVDCDIYQSKIHDKLDLENERGLNEVLIQGMALELGVQKTHEPNLDVITSGSLTTYLPEALGSRAMQNMLDKAGDMYDYVILDSAPLMAVSDTNMIMPFADGVLFVVQSPARAKELMTAQREMITDHLTFYGIVVNGVKRNSKSLNAYYYQK